MKVMKRVSLVNTMSAELDMKVFNENVVKPVVVTPREAVVNSVGTQYLRADAVVAGEPVGTLEVARLGYEAMLSGATTPAGKPRSVLAMLFSSPKDTKGSRTLLTLPSSALD